MLIFYIFAAITLAGALVVVLQQRAIYSVLALIVSFGSMAVLFFQLGAYFIAAIQVIIYAGAIMVLFLFVVMLIDPESELFALNRLKRLSVVALGLAIAFSLILLWALPGWGSTGDGITLDLGSKGNIRAIATELFQDYLLPFEVTSILILVAVLGAMVLAKRPE